MVPSIAVFPFVSVAGEDSSLQFYNAMSMGERILRGLAFRCWLIELSQFFLA